MPRPNRASCRGGEDCGTSPIWESWDDEKRLDEPWEVWVTFKCVDVVESWEWVVCWAEAWEDEDVVVAEAES